MTQAHRVDARLVLSAGVLLALAGPLVAQEARPRARDIGLTPGVLPPGPLNAVTDVPGVRVGHVTRIEGDRVRTGVTAIVPHGGNVFRDKVAGAVFVGNAFGKLAGSTQVNELGTIETPIILTNTLAVAAGIEGVTRYTLAQPGNADVRSVNALVGETNDGRLNDIRGMHVTADDVQRAIATAQAGAVAEGNVGAGTGTVAFGWKGGIGTSSRVVPATAGGYTVGVLVQSNYGGVLMLDGLAIGEALGQHPFAAAASDTRSPRPDVPARQDAADGSCMVVVATDAPLTSRDLERLAARAIFGLARTGSSFSNGSGDFAIAFSTAAAVRVPHGATAPAQRTVLPTDALSPLFEAVLEATEEAVANSLLRAARMTGNGVTVEALPVERVRALLGKR
jgi:D-aminopeptidase